MKGTTMEQISNDAFYTILRTLVQDTRAVSPVNLGVWLQVSKGWHRTLRSLDREIWESLHAKQMAALQRGVYRMFDAPCEWPRWCRLWTQDEVTVWTRIDGQNRFSLVRQKAQVIRMLSMSPELEIRLRYVTHPRPGDADNRTVTHDILKGFYPTMYLEPLEEREAREREKDYMAANLSDYIVLVPSTDDEDEDEDEDDSWVSDTSFEDTDE